MAQLIVRNIEEEVVDALKIRAAHNGRSAEAEHRELLRQALLGRSPAPLKVHLLSVPNVGTDEELEPRRTPARRVEL